MIELLFILIIYKMIDLIYISKRRCIVFRFIGIYHLYQHEADKTAWTWIHQQMKYSVFYRQFVSFDFTFFCLRRWIEAQSCGEDHHERLGLQYCAREMKNQIHVQTDKPFGHLMNGWCHSRQAGLSDWTVARCVHQNSDDWLKWQPALKFRHCENPEPKREKVKHEM